MAEAASFAAVPYRRSRQAVEFAVPPVLLVVLRQVIVTRSCSPISRKSPPTPRSAKATFTSPDENG